MMTCKMHDATVVGKFEESLRNFVVERLSNADNWWTACIPQHVRAAADDRFRRAQKANNYLNKPDFDVTDYLNFDDYESIITKKDNWKKHFADVFIDERVFRHKMDTLLSLRNDVMHGRTLNQINKLRLRLHCYDLLSQIHENPKQERRIENDDLLRMLGLDRCDL